MISPIAVDQSPVHEQLQFSWVEASDGPHIQEDNTIEYRGVRWYAASDALWIGKSTEGDGSIRFFVRENTNGSGLIWQVMHPMSAALTVWHGGEANRFDEAVEAAISVELIFLEHAGLVWFEQMSTMGPGWITEVCGQTVEVRQQRSGGWTWSHRVSESSIEGQICRLANSYPIELAGESASLEEAVQDALASPSRLKVLARQLLGDNNYEAGHRDGIEAAKRAVELLSSR